MRCWSLVSHGVLLAALTQGADSALASGREVLRRSGWGEVVSRRIADGFYEIRPTEGASAQWWASCPAQGLRVEWTGRGVNIGPRGLGPAFSAELDVVAWGLPGRLRKVEPGEWRAGACLPGGEENAFGECLRPVERDLGGLKESWVNRRAGVELILDVERPESGSDLRRLILDVAVRGARVRDGSDGSSVRLEGERGDSLRFAGLHALDAAGRKLEARMSAVDGGLRIEVEIGTDAVWPVRIDPVASEPSWTEGSGQQGSYFGGYDSLLSVGDVNCDGFADIAIGADSYDTKVVAEGAVFVYFGGSGGPGTTPAWFRTGDLPFQGFGWLDARGDVNGDGCDDLVVGSPGHASLDAPPYDGDVEEWYIWTYYGGVQTWLGSPGGLSATPDQSYVASERIGEGWTVACGGDVNGDGFADCASRSKGNDFFEPDIPAAIALFYGNQSGLGEIPSWSYSAPNPEFSNNFGFMAMTLAGDLDADGYDDLVVGDNLRSTYLAMDGAIYRFSGGADGLSPEPTEIATGPGEMAAIGESVASGSDLTGDGVDDLVCTATIWYGSAFVLPGAPDPSWDQPIAWSANVSGGGRLEIVGDVNGDGYDDLALAAQDGDDFHWGRVWLWLGSADGLSPTWDWTETSATGPPGPPCDSDCPDGFGFALAGGDVNGDGAADVVIGELMGSSDVDYEGLVHLYYGIPPDSDGDGSADALDCAPEDPTVHAGAAEVCDTIDSDCDGDLTEGCGDDDSAFDDDSASDDDSATGDDDGTDATGTGPGPPNGCSGCGSRQLAATLLGLAPIQLLRGRRRRLARGVRPGAWPFVIAALVAPGPVHAGSVGAALFPSGDTFPTCEEFRATANMCISWYRALRPPLSWDLGVTFPAGGYPNPWSATGSDFQTWTEYADTLICAPWIYAGIQVAPVIYPYERLDQASYSPTGANEYCSPADFAVTIPLSACNPVGSAALTAAGLSCTQLCGAAAGNPSGVWGDGSAAFALSSTAPTTWVTDTSGAPLPTGQPQPLVQSLSDAGTAYTPTWCDCYRWSEAHWGPGIIPVPFGATSYGPTVRGGIRWHRAPQDLAAFANWFAQLGERYDNDGIDDAWDATGSICNTGTGLPPTYNPTLPCPGGNPAMVTSSCYGRPATGEHMPPVLHWELGNEIEQNQDFRWFGNTPTVTVRDFYRMANDHPWGTVASWGADMAADYGPVLLGMQSVIEPPGAPTSAPRCTGCLLVNGGLVQPSDETGAIAPTSGQTWSPYLYPVGLEPTLQADSPWWYQDTFWTDLLYGSPISATPYATAVDVLAFHNVRGANAPYQNSAMVGLGAPTFAPSALASTGIKNWFEDIGVSAIPPLQVFDQFQLNELFVSRPAGAPPNEPDQADRLIQTLAFYFAHTEGSSRLFSYGTLLDQFDSSGTLVYAGFGTNLGAPNAAGVALAFVASLLDDDPLLVSSGTAPSSASSCGTSVSGEVWGQFTWPMSPTGTPSFDPDVPNVTAAQYEFDTASGLNVWVYWNEAFDPVLASTGAEAICDTTGPASLWFAPGIHYYAPDGTSLGIAIPPPDPNEFPYPIVACDDTMAPTATCPP